jgi:hypothetical protein
MSGYPYFTNSDHNPPSSDCPLGSLFAFTLRGSNPFGYNTFYFPTAIDFSTAHSDA